MKTSKITSRRILAMKCDVMVFIQEFCTLIDKLVGRRLTGVRFPRLNRGHEKRFERPDDVFGV